VHATTRVVGLAQRCVHICIILPGSCQHQFSIAIFST
jgi:hypothetical protein